jgi:hypothetical protein
MIDGNHNRGGLLPQDLNAEKATLGAMMVDSAALEAGIRIIGDRTDAFNLPQHQLVYATLRRMHTEGLPIDLVTMSDALRQACQLKAADGVEYLEELAQAVPGVPNAEYYARIVVRHWKARHIIEQARALSEWARRPDCDPDDLIEQATARIREIGADDPATGLLGPRIWTVGELLNQAEPGWLVDQIIPDGGLCVIYGPSGSGKSFAALHTALCVATGLAWFGREAGQGDSVFVAAEGSAGLKIRVRAWQQEHGVRPDRAYFIQEPLDLLNDAAVSAFLRAMNDADIHPRLVVLDTLARCLPGADENAAKDIGTAIRSADRIRTVTGAAVLLVHHTGKDGGAERGSSALRGAADCMIKLVASDDLLTLVCDKMKDSTEFEAMHVRRVTVEADGLESSCVLEVSSASKTNWTPNVRRVYDSLGEVSLGDGVSTTQWRDAAEVSKSTFYRARKTLVDIGLVIETKKPNQTLYRPAEPAEGESVSRVPTGSHGHIGTTVN